ncbi:MAG: YihY/virulence factor BrkB family protein [Propionibacteriales bacterium]|nr:YihY/virulence factor BrkB family protein [Propionibacteriales bacterium]
MSVPSVVRRWLRLLRRIVVETWLASFRYRIVGLAAESAFFTLLSLPPMLFALVGAVGFVTATFSPSTVLSLRDDILEFASVFLTPVGIDNVLAPTIDEVITGGRSDVVSIGFLIALWTGSRAISVFVETVTVMYGYQGRRGMVRQRAWAFAVFIMLMLIGGILIPLILSGPQLLATLLPDDLDSLVVAYWPVLGIVSVAVLTTMFHFAIPARHRWRSHLPGAALTMAIWLLGSYLLRSVLGFATDTTSIYGPLSAPIAVLLWLYVTSLAVLIGAALNASIAVILPGLVHPVAPDPDEADPDEADPDEEDAPEAG